MSIFNGFDDSLFDILQKKGSLCRIVLLPPFLYRRVGIVIRRYLSSIEKTGAK